MEGADITGNKQLLTFKLGDEEYALEIKRIREVLEHTTVTKVPRTPDFMIGVINLRGSVVPVIDLRLKFGMSKSEKTVDTCVIISEVSFGDELTILGALADSVKEVIELNTSQIEPAPKFGSSIKADFIQGMGKHDDQFIIILDIDKVFSSEELEMVQDATPNS